MSAQLPPGFELDEAPSIDELFTRADADNGLPSGFTRAIADAETGFLGDWDRRAKARSPANAHGVMQFIPETGARYGLHSLADLQDPYKAIPAGGRHLGDLYRQFGSPELAAAAYNAGAGAVTKHGGVPPYRETQKYVPRVMKNLGSSQHVAHMRQKYTPNVLERAAGGLFDAFIPAAQAADQPPPGNGVMLPPGFAVDAEPVAPTGQLPPGFELDPEPAGGLPPAVQTGVRSTIKGLSAPLTLAADAVNAPVNLIAKGVNAIRPGTMGYLPPASAYVDAGLQAVGVDPRAASNTERAVTAGLGAATGAGLAGMMGAAAPAGSLAANRLGVLAAQPGRQALGAMSASASSDAARELGLPPAAQIGAGIVGGMLPGAGASTVAGIGAGVGRLAAPFTRGGKEKIAGRVLNKQAAAPNAALARLEDPAINRPLVPGSQPTLAEVTQDPGLARLASALESSPTALDAGVGHINSTRIAQMDNAIRETLDRVNKAPKTGAVDVLDKIGVIKQRIGQTFEDQLKAKGIDPAELPVATTHLEAKLAELAKKHQGNKNLEALINATGSEIADGTNFTRLWNNRQSLDDLIYEKLLTATAGSKLDMKRLGNDLRSAMNQDLIAAVPEFEPFLNRYARMSRAEGRLKLGRELIAKTENTARATADEGQLYGDRLLSNRAMDRLDIPGAERRAGAKLSNAQRAAFEAAQEEKRRANFLATGGAPINSRTAQNLAINQIISDDILGGLLGDNARTGLAGFARNVLQSSGGRVADALTRPAQADVLQMIQRGLIDPAEGQRLLNLGRLRSTQAFMPSLESAAKTGVLSEIYSRMQR